MLLRVVSICLCLIATSVSALTIDQFEHTVWASKDGLAGGVAWSSAVPNGMLLLKTSAGYQVFDGVEFHSYGRDTPPPFSDHANMLGQRSPTGATYFIHPNTRKLMRSWNGRTEIVDDEKDSSAWTSRFVFDQQGIGWLPALGHLFRLEGLKVEEVGASWGIPEETMLGDAIVDSRGTVWVGSFDSMKSVAALHYLPRGARKFERFAHPVSCFPITQAPDGSLWCSSEYGLSMVTVKEGRPVGLRLVTNMPTASALFDSRGGFWVTVREGMAHVADWRQLLEPGVDAALRADMFTPKDGLSADAVKSISEDAAGNIWVGTTAGLERFRAARFTPLKLPRRNLGSALAADPDGSLWVGNWDRSLMNIADGRIKDEPALTHVTAIRTDGNGRVWVVGEQNIWRKDPGGTFTALPRPPFPTQSVHQFAEDDAGAYWIQSGRRLVRFQGGQWSKPEGSDVPPGNTPYFILADLQKQLWFVGRRPFVLKRGVLREVQSQAYIDAVFHSLTGFARGSRVWVGGLRGVGAFEGDAFRPLKLKDDVAKDITGIVETRQGDLWLHGLAKAFRISADQVNAGLKGQVVTSEVFDFRDGLRAATSQGVPRPTLVEDATGRLWFSTTHGLFWIDPRAKEKAVAPPPSTLIKTVKSDGRPIEVGSNVQLPANPGRIEFAYSAAALDVSDRVRFRYRLEGVDSDWQEAGTRRTAYYTQLAPGRYRFAVAASNERGEWAAEPTPLAVEVQPAWYQTLWFRSLVVLMLLGMLWLLVRLRVRVLAARERDRMRQIAAERERIARDLHDTLLQSMQGVILGFQGLAITLPEQHETRRSIEGQLDRADQLLGEARDRVRNLRTTGDDAMSLQEAFELAASELEAAPRIEVDVEGRPRSLRPRARDHIYLIGREALLNAVMHGGGGDIQVRLHYGPRGFGLCVRDHGIGIDPTVLALGERPGHYGIVGMQERAQELGSELTFARLAEGGTEVWLRVPAAVAFETAPPAKRWRRLRRQERAGAPPHTLHSA